ncbi:unnamed protein product [Gordionus sp. m RMFG-2023]|uniref:uncharacterized protein LOC135928415 isoform X2 n=1 Tax=Gordionus sp. m RMFG-2023 TaxID=3053472 RepID=UPI0030E22CD3
MSFSENVIKTSFYETTSTLSESPIIQNTPAKFQSTGFTPDKDYVRYIYTPEVYKYPYKSELDCLNSQLPQAYHLEKPYCNASYDSILCWPPTKAGVLIMQSCPPLKGIDQSKYAFRKCSFTGTWIDKYPTSTSTKGWTNYTLCLKPEASELLNKVKPRLDLFSSVTHGARIMEMVGLSLSLISLIAAITIFFSFRNLRNDRTKIHRHLFIAMIIQVLIRLILYSDQYATKSIYMSDVTVKSSGHKGIDNTEILCETFYIFLEYAKTVLFMWMLVEGFHLHNIIVASVFESKPNMWIFNSIGWGVPLILTGVWAGIFSRVQNKSSCWYLYSFSKYYWILEGPRLAVIIVNLIFLLNIIRVLVSKLRDTRSTEAEQAKKAVKAAIVLLPLLGITNSLNLVPTPWNTALFIIWTYGAYFLISFQGFFVSLIYCFCNQEVGDTLRAAWKRRSFNKNHQNASKSNICFTSTSNVEGSDHPSGQHRFESITIPLRGLNSAIRTSSNPSALKGSFCSGKWGGGINTTSRSIRKALSLPDQRRSTIAGTLISRLRKLRPSQDHIRGTKMGTLFPDLVTTTVKTGSKKRAVASAGLGPSPSIFTRLKRIVTGQTNLSSRKNRNSPPFIEGGGRGSSLNFDAASCTRPLLIRGGSIAYGNKIDVSEPDSGDMVDYNIFEEMNDKEPRESDCIVTQHPLDEGGKRFIEGGPSPLNYIKSQQSHLPRSNLSDESNKLVTKDRPCKSSPIFNVIARKIKNGNDSLIRKIYNLQLPEANRKKKIWIRPCNNACDKADLINDDKETLSTSSITGDTIPPQSPGLPHGSSNFNRPSHNNDYATKDILNADRSSMVSLPTFYFSSCPLVANILKNPVKFSRHNAHSSLPNLKRKVHKPCDLNNKFDCSIKNRNTSENKQGTTYQGVRVYEMPGWTGYYRGVGETTLYFEEDLKKIKNGGSAETAFTYISNTPTPSPQ